MSNLLEGTIDLNNLFNLNYNFDLLKGVLETIMKNQKGLNGKISEMEERDTAKDARINQLERELAGLKVNIRSGNGSNEMNTNVANYNTGGKSESSNRIGEEVTNKNDDAHILERIIYLEKQVANLQQVSDDVREISKKVKEHDSIFIDHDRKIQELNDLFLQLSEKVDRHENQIQEINIKLVDLNLIDLVKDRLAVDGKQDESILINLISNLQKKFDQKSEIDSRRFKTLEDEIMKLKNDIVNIKNTNENFNKSLIALQEDIQMIYSKLQDLRDYIHTSTDENKTYFNAGIRTLDENIDNKIKDINNRINLLIESLNNQGRNDIPLSVNNVNYEDSKLLKELQKRLAEMEKTLKLLPTTINLDLWKEISKINEILNTKADITAVNELRDLIAQLQSQLKFLKEQVDTLNEDKSVYDDILSLKKRIESLASAVYNMKANDDGPNVTPQKMLPYDTSKFVDYSTFNEFKANMMREFDNVHLNISELRKLIDEIFLILKTKISDKEMKNLEDFLFIKLEEFKSACNKKFADKNETARNLKYLEQQIKNILETYLKKMEKGDNWLLAKKPIGGNSCASCEAYIGDLHDNSQYIPWNKYPMRDPNDKLYRIGNGFSKMLQMLNVEQLQQNRSPGAFKTTQDFYKPNFEGQEKKNSALPKINNLNQSLNMSADDVEVEEDVEIEDPNRPKIMKIYKKSKEKKVEY